MLGEINHIEIYVGDLEKTSEFWGWFFGELKYKPFQKWDKGMSYKLGGTYIVFVQVEEKFNNPKYHRKRIGLNHLAFRVNSKEEVDKFYTEFLNANEIPTLYETPKPFPEYEEGYYAVYFEDPDRIKLEVAYYP